MDITFVVKTLFLFTVSLVALKVNSADFKCDSKHAIYVLQGNNDGFRSTFKCKQIARDKENTHCSWSRWYSWPEFNIDCGAVSFMTGVDHRHDTEINTEWLRFECCTNPEIKLIDCTRTPEYVGGFQNNIHFEVHGIFQSLELGRRGSENRWKVKHCSYQYRSQWTGCRHNEAVSRIHGVFDAHWHDRDWTYECRQITEIDQVTDVDGTMGYSKLDVPFSLRCMENYFICGIYSWGDYRTKDRQYRINCCKAKNVKIQNCETRLHYYKDSFLEKEINEHLPRYGVVYTGLKSRHYDKQEDRIWAFEMCEYILDENQFQCNDGEGIYKFESTYNDAKLDRSWTWYCRKVTETFDDCYWTDYLNSLDGHLSGICHGNYVLAGIGSYFSDWARDRSWKIRCCTSEKLAINFCQTGKNNINEYRKDIAYETDDEMSVLTGLQSDHNNHQEDRLWKVNTCHFLKKPEQYFECPDGYGLFHIKSIYYKMDFDRIWDFKCSRIANTFDNDCYWVSKDYVNEADFEINVKCDSRYVIAGINSSFVDGYNDRRWNIRCCRNKKASFTECATTPRLINQYHQRIDFEVNLNYVLTGMESSHDNFNEDRRWKFSYCKFQCCQ